MPAESDRIVSTMPDGLWSQTQPSIPAMGEGEPVQRIRVPATMVYSYTPGTAPTHFLRGLAEKKILGGRHGSDGDVYVPSRGMDPVLGLPTTEQVEVGPSGTITSYCVVHIGFGENAPPTPFVSALILPDGAEVSLYGTILGIPHDQMRIGMRVAPVWAEELTTSFENITHWESIDEPDVAAEELKGHM